MAMRCIEKNYSAIVLAAGVSSRMGQANKLLMDVNGESLLQRCVTSIVSAGVDDVTVVLGHESELTREKVSNNGVCFVTNTEYSTGQNSSVRCGLSALTGTRKAVLICLADQPFINSSHIRDLIEAFENMPRGEHILVPVYFEQRGNPVIISEFVRNEVLQSENALSCREYIDFNPEMTRWLPVQDSAYIKDIDTPEDYTELSEGL